MSNESNQPQTACGKCGVLNLPHRTHCRKCGVPLRELDPDAAAMPQIVVRGATKAKPRSAEGFAAGGIAIQVARQPPKYHFEDVAPSLRTVLRLAGRIGIVDYWVYTFLVSGLMISVILCGAYVISLTNNDNLVLAAGLPSAACYLVGNWALFALQVRRFHDHDMPGTWVWMNFVPIFGPIYVFIKLGCLPGTPGPNRFGNDLLTVGPNDPQWNQRPTN